MLLALVLYFDHIKVKRLQTRWIYPHKRGINTYGMLRVDMPSTLGPIVVISRARKELKELWEGSTRNLTEKTHLTEV
ncbi:hypothetical protein Hanom_Chr07g00602071 [Helianthus anomalus]